MSVKVKICGLTNLSDAQVAIDAGADYLGFILYPKSPRYVAPAQIQEIVAALSLPPGVHTVGVFVNTPADEVRQILDETGLHFAQLHGDEPESALATLQGRAYKAVRPADATTAEQATVFVPYPADLAPQLLLDAYSPNAYGGTGQQADWSLAAQVTQSVSRLLLAGGLTAENVQRAIKSVAPWGVDVASGVEASPGRKDHDLVRAFVANAKAAA